jgi:hypothetical protein
MFTTKLDLFSIGTVIVLTHTKLIPKPVYILDIIMVEPIDVLTMKLGIPLDIIKRHLHETFFHPKVRKIIVDETPTW